MGGMQLGSIWRHGGYVAPDWAADGLHREVVALLGVWAGQEGARYDDLGREQQSALRERLRAEMRRNTYDPKTRTVVINDDRARAAVAVSDHYKSLFGNAPVTATLRENYEMRNNTVPDPNHREALSAFFWWTAWAATTERPGRAITYTNKWPSEELVGNRPPSSTFELLGARGGPARLHELRGLRALGVFERDPMDGTTSGR